MSSVGCADCFKVNKDESLIKVRQEAKQKAIQTNEAQAIYKEGNEYYYISASAAGGYPVIEFVSQYS